MSNKSRLENIQQMESIFNELQSSLKSLDTALKSLDTAFKAWKKLQPKYKKLINYYESKQRQKDYDDTNSWKLKPIWPHGILSEDAIYDFDSEQRNVLSEIKKSISKFFK